MSKHIVIFEPSAGGHQMEYIRHFLASALARADLRITLLTTEPAARHVNCQRLAHDFAPVLEVQVAPELSVRHRGFRLLGHFAEEQWQHAEMATAGLRALKRTAVDFVLVPHLESIGLLQLGLRPAPFDATPWATIAIGTRFHHRECGIRGPFRWIDPVQRFFFRKVLRDPTLACLGTIDPYLPGVAGHPKVAYCPDPCQKPTLADAVVARAAFGLRESAFVVLVFGVIDRRKCLDVLLAGAARIRSDIDLTVFVAGPQDQRDVGHILCGDTAAALREDGRLVELNRFIVTGQDIDPMSAADAVWVYYQPTFVYSSSVLVHAALAACPVIVRRQGVVGRQVHDHGLGLVLPNGTPDTVAAALTTLAGDPAMRRRMGHAGASAFSSHTPEAFARPVVSAMLEAMGLPCSPAATPPMSPSLPRAPRVRKT